MSKFILMLFAFLAILFVAFSFVLGLIRRFLGLAPKGRVRASASKKQATPSSVLYHDSKTEVLRGESPSPRNTSSYGNIRDASFTEGKTDTSSGR